MPLPLSPVPTYVLTITAGTGGSITTGSNGDYAAGTVINITATAAANYSFSQWTSTGGGTFQPAGRCKSSYR
ncbi:InlB B-repeat-containing protein [Desulfotruncus arcticus]|uniref:InlB B-repeat-containing protein n=1 Tax=Desulfotruncus arcticus TaxID=341036 RepID=UPI00338E04FD